MDLPREPEAFTEILHSCFERHVSCGRLDITGPLELSIDGRCVDLRDLYRAMHTLDLEDSDPIVVINQFVDGQLDAIRFEEMTLSFDVIAPRVMPRICRSDEIRRRDSIHIAHQPFINEVAAQVPRADILLGKPMPVAAARNFYLTPGAVIEIVAGRARDIVTRSGVFEPDFEKFYRAGPEGVWLVARGTLDDVRTAKRERR